MTSFANILVGLVLAATSAQIPAPTGFVTDTTGRVGEAAKQRMTHLIEELKQKTGAEIAVLVVNTTEPLDDFNYAMQVADQWKVGRKGEDTGVVVLLALKDRKLRILTGYGVEGILPDGLVGEIQDRAMLPALRQGNVDEALWGGVAEIARRIAESKGVTLTGLPERRAVAPTAQIPGWVILLAIIAIMMMMRYGRRFGRGGPLIIPGGFGGGDGGFHGGFGGGGGGFGGFGGGSFGGGGAGRSW